MKSSSAALKCCVMFIVLVVRAHFCFAQIIVYTNDTGGVLNAKAAHVTADTLKRVNNAARLSTPCTNGFSTRGFTNVSSYSDTLPGVEIWAKPDTGYYFKVDTFKVDLRHSPTGPANARFAYSVNAGATWIDQGTDQFPHASGTCDSMDTCTWVVPITVNYPQKIMFRVYGFNTSVTTGTGNLQIMNLMIIGTVHTLKSLMFAQDVPDEESFIVYPNPAQAEAAISYHLEKDDEVCITVYNIVGQKVTSVVNSELQQSGNYIYPLSQIAQGVYFVRLSVGDRAFTRRFVKL